MMRIINRTLMTVEDLSMSASLNDTTTGAMLPELFNVSQEVPIIPPPILPWSEDDE